MQKNMQMAGRNFTTGSILFIGIILGFIGAELGLRTIISDTTKYRTVTEVMPPQSTFWQGLQNMPKQNARQNWLVFGGQTAAGIGIAPQEWFGHLYGQMAGLRFYNAAFKGGSAYLLAAQKKVNQVPAQKAVVVVDMAIRPSVLANQLNSFKQKPEQSTSFLQRLALLRIFGVEPKAEGSYSEEVAAQIATHVTNALMPYAQNDESAIALLVPARGYWLEGKIGTMHRTNQDALSLALRRISQVYVVDIAYMMRSNYKNPLVLYGEDGSLNAEGHKMLAEGLRRQMMVFSEWKNPDELTPAERLKLDQDLQKHYEKEAKRRVQLPF